MSNFVNLVFNGQLVREPVATENGAVLHVAVNRVYVNAKGEKVDNVTYFTTWLGNGQAENALKYLVKGQNVTVVAGSMWQKMTVFNNMPRMELHCNASQVHYGAKPQGNGETVIGPVETEPEKSSEAPF